VPDKQKIIQGRKAVDAYRVSHIQLHSKPWHKGVSKEHATLQDALLAELNGLGFESLESFFTASRLLNQATLLSSLVQISECDRCIGKEREGACICYTLNMEELGKLPHVGGHGGHGFFGLIHLYPEHWKAHIPLKMGDTFSFFPGCNINIKVVKEPEIDWEWQ